ncbi:hypothetical protein DFJ74DRAFT_707266 [Hyaloraphidium curvatum]|nr:hypothetical protein DFJ74DRAFT_707266 [Hyaloraphidium curvatum]
MATELTAEQRAACLEAAWVTVPEGHIIQRRFFDAAHGGGAVDARIAAVYREPVFSRALEFCGARLRLDLGGGAAEEAIEAAAERAYAAAAAEGLSARGADAHGPERISTLWAVFAVAGWCSHTMGRVDAARAGARRVARVLRQSGMPAPPAPSASLDDLYFRGLWYDLLASVVHLEMRLASAVDGMRPSIDPPRDFPGVPLITTTRWLAEAITDPRHVPGAPPPPHLAAAVQNLWASSRAALGWLDPELDPPVPHRVRDAFAGVLGLFDVYSLSDILLVNSYFAFKTGEFRRWIRAEAGLSLLDLIVAEETPHEPNVVFRAASYSNPGAIAEAERRRIFLLEAAAALRAQFPPSLLAAFRSGDLDSVLAAEPWLDRGPQFQSVLIITLLDLARVELLLVAPDLLEDPDDEGHLSDDEDDGDGWGGRDVASGGYTHGDPIAAGRVDSGVVADHDHFEPRAEHPWQSAVSWDDVCSADPGTDSAPITAAPLSCSQSPLGAASNDSALHRYFFTPAFSRAASIAADISSLSRILLSRFADRLGTEIYTTFACHAAAHAAWIFVLLLKRVRRIAADAHHADAARAPGLHGTLLSHLRNCLDLLSASGKAAHRETGMHLAAFADADPAAPRDLRRARAAASGAPAASCRHARGDPSARGFCWECTAARARRGSEERVEADPLARLGAGGRRVRFAEGVEVGETWGKDEYQRSRHEEGVLDPRRVLVGLMGQLGVS